MSNKTIAKFACLVILVTAANVLNVSCSNASSSGQQAVRSEEFSSSYQKPVEVGRIESPEVIESSGLAASQCQPDVYWTHNDSGDDAFVFAMTSRGKHLGTWRVTNATNLDWEDMAVAKAGDGTCVLYIGDIGNNKLAKVDMRIYRVKEPTVSSADRMSTKKSALPTEAASTLTFRYSDTPHNAETLIVHPVTGDLYVLTKRVDGPSLVFKISPQFGSPQTQVAAKVGEVSVPAVPDGFLTGGAVSPDGTKVILADYFAGYELDLGAASNFDEIWKSRPVRVDLGERKIGEAVTFTPDGSAIITTSEKKHAPILQINKK